MEQWLPIPNFEHCGEVSNLGRIRSPRGLIRKTVIGNNGYIRVGLRKIDGKNTNYVTVHRLVALAFCEGFEEKLTVNHIDGNKHNNVALNLEWVNHKNNTRHAYRLGLRKNNHRKPIIPYSDRETLLEERKKGISYREIGKRYGVCHASVHRFLNGSKRKTIIFEVA